MREQAVAQVGVIHVGNFILGARRGLQGADAIEHRAVVKVDSDHGIGRLWGLGLFFDAQDALAFEYGNAEALRVGDFFQQQKGDVMTPVRAKYKGILVGNMGYSAEEARMAITEGKLDAVAFGTAFLANPDLPLRLETGAALNTPNPSTFYTPGPVGYTDYPSVPVAR